MSKKSAPVSNGSERPKTLQIYGGALFFILIIAMNANIIHKNTISLERNRGFSSISFLLTQTSLLDLVFLCYAVLVFFLAFYVLMLIIKQKYLITIKPIFFILMSILASHTGNYIYTINNTCFFSKKLLANAVGLISFQNENDINSNTFALESSFFDEVSVGEYASSGISVIATTKDKTTFTYLRFPEGIYGLRINDHCEFPYNTLIGNHDLHYKCVESIAHKLSNEELILLKELSKIMNDLYNEHLSLRDNDYSLLLSASVALELDLKFIEEVLGDQASK